ncbi:hypothetical protein GH808_06195 [Acetobacterium fimetarium]|uniref:ABC transporter permease n=1 Tax=Acetobacterium fimetarium TaxID=52691 RepID=A0ABR6WTZ9_9FIRM|nr:hypothetical protein [Acetobacterium fimetarium]MBC3804026.1 hypothetical protein [Acetobacterium fimetarium]
MKNLLRYHFKVYLKSNKLLLPFLIYLIYLFTAYSIMPYAIVSSFSESAGVIFFIMTFVGFSYSELENPVTEQLVLLKVQNDNLYYLSRIIVLAIVGVIMSVIGILYPVIGNIYNHAHLFTRSLILSDIVFGFVLHCTMGLLGALTGSLFHPRIIKNRKIAILMVFFTAVLAIAKGALINEIPSMDFVTWVFPPVYDILVTLTGCEFFSLQALVMPFLWGLIYGTVLITMQLHFLKKNKF